MEAAKSNEPAACKKVIVIGAGIGGLTVANALVRKALDVEVYERVETLNRQRGAGTGLSQNGQSCLHSIGFTHEMIMNISTPVLEHILGKGTEVLGRSDYPARLYEKYGIPLTGTLRGDLVNLLASPLREIDALHCGKMVVKIEQGQLEQEGKVKVHLNSGEIHEADLVIGADGINSTVAQLLIDSNPNLEEDPPIYSGYSIFFGVIENYFRDKNLSIPSKNAVTLGEMMGHPNAIVQVIDEYKYTAPTLAPDLIIERLSGGLIFTNNPGKVLSPTKLFMVPGGAGDEKSLVWKLSYRTDKPPGRREWRKAEGLSVRQELQDFLEAQNYDSSFPVWKLLKETSDERLLHFGLYSRRHRPKDLWYQGRVVLIGDAAHATLPHLGQGANMAIEDAIVLTQCLEERGFVEIPQALEDFYQKRHHRNARIVNTSRYMGWLLDVRHPWLVWLRDRLFRWLMEGDWYLKFAEKEILTHCPVPLLDPRSTSEKK